MLGGVTQVNVEDIDDSGCGIWGARGQLHIHVESDKMGNLVEVGAIVVHVVFDVQPVEIEKCQHSTHLIAEA